MNKLLALDANVELGDTAVHIDEVLNQPAVHIDGIEKPVMHGKLYLILEKLYLILEKLYLICGVIWDPSMRKVIKLNQPAVHIDWCMVGGFRINYVSLWCR